jgi:RNA polymerase sigma-70 factor (ECF subfamily)
VENVAPFAPQPRPDAVFAPWNEEGRLLAAIRGGDRTAAEELVERTYSAVYASLYRMCADSEMAADLTQETYRKAWEALGRFDGRSQFFTWLYRIAYTTFLNAIRRPRRMTSIEDAGVPEMRDHAPGADEVLSGREEGARMRAAVMQLPDDLRFTVTAHFWGGLPVKEIARMEDITGAAVRKRLRKAFAMLELSLDEEFR